MSKFKRHVSLYAIAVVCMLCINDVQAEKNGALTERQKAIIPIAAFTAIGDMPELEIALNEGLDADLTINEVKEILVHAYAYAGFPRSLNGITSFMTVLEKRKARGINDTIGEEATPPPADFDRNAFGHETRNLLVGRDLSNRSSGYSAFAPIIDQFLVVHLFADIFYRDVLNFQDRELVTISMLAAMSGTEPQLKSHLKVSINVGMTNSQLEDFVTVLDDKVSVESANRADMALGDLLGLDNSVDLEKSVRVIRKTAPVSGSTDKFTGDVTVESLFASESIDSYRGGIVNFEAGARTAWHIHPYGQTLIVISGRGLVQSEGEASQEIVPGDVVWIPANERHWHGAAPDSPMSHVAISSPRDGATVEWHEHVTDEQYGR